MSFKDKILSKKKAKSKKGFFGSKNNTETDAFLTESDGSIDQLGGSSGIGNSGALPDDDFFIDDIVDENELQDDIFASDSDTGFMPEQQVKRSNTKLKLYIAIALLALLALVVLSYYFFTSTNGADPVVQSPASAPAKPAQEAKKQSAKNKADENTASAQAQPVAMPDVNQASKKQLLESIDSPLPENKTLAAEELDALADERARLDEQERLLEEQLQTAEKLAELKAKKIEMLEKKIAEAQAAAGQVPSGDSSAITTQTAN